MYVFTNPKSVAKTLRHALSERGIALSHGQCLDIVARQMGYDDWNVLSARIEAGGKPLSVPEGWYVAAHSRSEFYRIGIDPEVPGAARIESLPDAKIPEDHTGVLMQSVSAENFRGQNIQLTAELRTRDAALATIWLRADGPLGKRSLRFDNMIGRKKNGPLEGTHDWTRRSIVLDVPQEAESIHFGFFLQGHGAAWARGFALDPVDRSIAVTGRPRLLDKPTNLDFKDSDAA